MAPRHTVNGEEYDAVNAGNGTWMVHWYKKDKTMVEALLHANTDVPQPSALDVIRQAIRIGSWA